jgi:hypothetical protein
VAIWIYTLVFAFSSLWFAHYCLAALELLRKQNNALAQAPPAQAAINLIVDESPPETLPKPATGFGLPSGRPDSFS